MSTTDTPNLPAVLSVLDRLTEEELIQLNHIVVERLRLIRQIHSHGKMMNFRLGQRVRFTSTSGQVIRGFVKSHNRKSVTVLSETHGTWRVAPDLLQAD